MSGAQEAPRVEAPAYLLTVTTDGRRHRRHFEPAKQANEQREARSTLLNAAVAITVAVLAAFMGICTLTGLHADDRSSIASAAPSQITFGWLLPTTEDK